jgi:hypothetical protein
MRQARRLSRQSGETEHVHGEANYAARTCPQQRRIIIKAEAMHQCVTATLLHYSINHCQSQPRPFTYFLGRKEGLEDVLL